MPARAAQVDGGAGRILETLFGCQPDGSDLVPFLCFLLVLQHRTSSWSGGNIVMDGGGHD